MANQQATPEGDSSSTAAASTKSGFDNMNLPFSDDKRTILNPAFLEWHRGDQLLLSWIISSLSEVVHSQVVGLDSSYKVWTTIKRFYAA
ncbi:hypothetical protein EJ110_NYTH51621 [Nymphaea thermarum]|nr:hypothetical protein EJ110_NYTH51621 [Nymphaea thermarum]